MDGRQVGQLVFGDGAAEGAIDPFELQRIASRRWFEGIDPLRSAEHLATTAARTKPT